jgi:DNA (cytosine-5)-methyltransferase 1
MTFGSLFTGVGGMDLGLEWAGLECRWQVEIDDYCRRVLARYWPRVRRERDATAFPPDDPERWSVDLVAGGDPCQENSRARSGNRTTQLSLGHEFVRIVAAIRPRLVLRENPSKVRPDAPWPWWRFAESLRGLGYDVLPFRLRACCLGADHERERLFVLASMGDAHGLQSGLGGRVEFAESRHQARDVDLWTHQPEPPRMADGIPDRVVRNTRLGNALPPVMAEWIGRRILASA